MLPDHDVPAARRRLFPLLTLPMGVRRVDRAAAHLMNGRERHPRSDRAWKRLSHSADHGTLWLTTAAVLLLVGDRRAGSRGALSLGMASLIANAVGKNLIGGPRPLLDDVPIARQLRRQPRSASFPSGHTASAVAFVTGVALESPRTGLVLAPLAAAVSYSRLKVGAHWLSDVVGGALLGAGVAVAGRLVLPVPAHPAGPAALAGEPIELPASSRGEGVLVVSNGASGAARRRDPVALLRRRLPEARYRSLGDTDLGEMVAAELRRRNPPRVLAVVGGDGTVETAARVALEHDLPLLVVPGGTFDHFSRAVGTDSVDAAVAALSAGSGARVDVAAVDVDGEPHHLAINATALGVYADYLAERDRLEGRLGKRVAGLVSGVQILRRGRTVTIERDDDAASRGDAGASDAGATGRDAVGRDGGDAAGVGAVGRGGGDVEGRGGSVRQGAARTAWSVFVGVGRNDDDVVSPMRRRALDDGSLEVRTLSSGSRLGRIGALSSLAFGPRSTATLRLLGLLPEKEAFSTEVTSRFAVTVAGAPRPAIAHDGEGDTSLPETAEHDGYRYEVRLLPRALRVYRPRG
ncbi:hypothetical protein ASF17_11310 [Frigoribacterium sp. Leaf263]|nr:bifunctional phosphatase PAP2/diacylglycerol kinase family protein [Frigoribacterium sp. Leaf263]KQO81711.1 hypothetical protein ASF17_11310 [Frigoribacterium sp. Leaf263]